MGNNDLPDIDSLWDYHHPDESELRFRDLLRMTGMSTDYRLELLTQIARTLSLQRRFDEAHALLDDIERFTDNMGVRPRIRAWLERGRTFNSSGNPDQARPLLDRAWTLAADTGEDFLAVDAAHMLAIVAPPDKALEYNLRSLDIAQKSADPEARRWIGSLYNNIGWTFHDQGDYATARDYLVKARDFRAAQADTKEWLIARWCVARVERDLGLVRPALAEQQDLLAAYEALGEPSGYVYEEVGECLLLLGQPDTARPHFALAYELLSQDDYLIANEPARLARLRDLGFI